MESDVLEVFLSHLQHIARVGKEDVATLFVLGHILIFALLEVVEFLLVIALYPTGLIQMNGLPTTLGIILVLQTILDNLELQLSYRTNNLAVVELVHEELSYTLVHQLADTLLQLLGLHGVGILDVLKHFG